MADLGALFSEVVESWPSYRDNRASGKPAKVDSNHRAYQLVLKDIPHALTELLGDAAPRFKVEGSTGAGNVTAAPWVASFDLRVTDSATHGLYPVYLFSIDLQHLYLSAAIGVTAFQQLFGSSTSCYDRLRWAREFVAKVVDLPSWGFDIGPLDLATDRRRHKLHALYEQGSIAHQRYRLADLPTSESLAADLRRMLRLYEELISNDLVPDPARLAESAAPAIEEAPTISFEEFTPLPPADKRGSGDSTKSSKPRRSQQSKKVGDAGEAHVLRYERDQLEQAGRPDLAKRVRRLEEINEYPGWDITSYYPDGREKLIEVKATSGKTITTVELTANEWEAARHPDNRAIYHLCLVTKALSKQPRIRSILDPAAHVGSWRDRAQGKRA